MWVMAGLLAVYVAVGLGFRAVETRLLYRPAERLFGDCTLPDGVEPVAMGAERGLLTATGSDAVVVFYHGNASSACNWRFLGPNHIAPRGYDTLVVEYPGYAGDPRTPSKAGLHAAADAARRWAQERYADVTVFGNSIGTAPAAHHAGQGADRLVLFAPFDTMVSLLRGKGFWYPGWMLKNRYDLSDALGPNPPPTTLLYGALDTLIPPRHSIALADALRAKGGDVTVIERVDIGHNGFFANPEFDAFLARSLPAR